MNAMTDTPTNAMDSRRALAGAIEAFLVETGMTPAAFGAAALDNPSFVATLRKGADMRLDTADRVLVFMGAEPIGPRFRLEVEGFIGVTGVKPYLFGEQAMGDPSFVGRLLGGASPRLATLDRVRTWMAASASTAERAAMRSWAGDRAAAVATDPDREEVKQMNDRYLNTREAAALLGLSPRTLDRYRVSGDGPAFHKFGNRVRYLRADVETWAAERRMTSTADDGSSSRRAA